MIAWDASRQRDPFGRFPLLISSPSTGASSTLSPGDGNGSGPEARP
jgi:hypothetical protein